MLKRLCQDEPQVKSLQVADAFKRSRTNTLRIGRDTASTFTLQASRCPLLISRHHAVLRKIHHNLELEDLGSTNGTYVNERRLGPAERFRLHEGDIVSFGGGSRVKAANAGPEEGNPFVFRVKQLVKVFESTAESNLSALAPVASRQRDECIDLTVSDDSPPAAIPTQNNLPRQSRSVNQSRPPSLPLSAGRIGETTGLGRPKKRQRVPLNCFDLDDFSSGDEVQFKQHGKAAAAPPPPAQSPALEQKQGSLIEEQFECQICRELMVASHSLVPCGHMFCGECIATWLQKKPSCPNCRANITAPPVPSLTVDNMLDGLVGQMLDKEGLAERSRRKEIWKQQGARISQMLRAVGRRHGMSGPQNALRSPAGIGLGPVYAGSTSGLGHEFEPRLPRGRNNRNSMTGHAMWPSAVPGPFVLSLPPPPPSFSFRQQPETCVCNICHSDIASREKFVHARYGRRGESYHMMCAAQIPSFRGALSTGQARHFPGSHLIHSRQWVKPSASHPVRASDRKVT